MKQILILGAGTAGTMMSNHLSRKLDKKEWEIEIIDEREEHHYQPGYLFLPFDIYKPEDIIKKTEDFIPDDVLLTKGGIDRILPEDRQVKMMNGAMKEYDILIIATGVKIAPEEVEGMNGTEWYKSIFDFYTFEGALALRDKLREWTGGKMLVHITEMPIKCPVAPLEFAFLADSFFKQKSTCEIR